MSPIGISTSNWSFSELELKIPSEANRRNWPNGILTAPRASWACKNGSGIRSVDSPVGWEVAAWTTAGFSLCQSFFSGSSTIVASGAAAAGTGTTGAGPTGEITGVLDAAGGFGVATGFGVAVNCRGASTGTGRIAGATRAAGVAGPAGFDAACGIGARAGATTRGTGAGAIGGAY
jgi:hypothetical protein